jgi:hypothetical protein
VLQFCTKDKNIFGTKKYFGQLSVYTFSTIENAFGEAMS